MEPAGTPHTLDTMKVFATEVLQVSEALAALQPEDVKMVQMQDGKCSALISLCQSGSPRENKLPLHVAKYVDIIDELSVCNGLLLKGIRMVVPAALWPSVLALIHEGDQVINRYRSRDCESVWWPGISTDIKDLVYRCEQCASYRVNSAEPLCSTALPDHPWEVLGTDLLHLNGQTFLLVVDYYSQYLKVLGGTQGTLKTTAC